MCGCMMHTGDVSEIPASSVTSLVYGSVTSAQVSARDFWPLHLYAGEPGFVRLNVTVWLSLGGRGTGAVVGLYARRGTFPSHTRYDIFHAIDVDKLADILSSAGDSRTRRAAPSNVRHLQVSSASTIAATPVFLNTLYRQVLPGVHFSSLCRTHRIAITKRTNLMNLI